MNIRAVSDDINLLPTGSIMYSSLLPPLVNASLGSGIREHNGSSYVILHFTQPVYLLYVTVIGFGITFNFSFMYENLSGECVTYMTVDGASVRNHMYSYITACMYMCYFIELHGKITRSGAIFFTVDTH